MSKKKVDNKKSKTVKINYERRKLEWYYFLPILLIAAIIPLITFAKIITIEGQELLHWKGGKTQIDFFSYWKSIYFQIFTFVGLAFYLILLKMKKLPLKIQKKYYIPMIVYALFVIFSSITSENQIVAMRGFIEQFQGMGVLLCYIITTFIIINFVNNERDVKIILSGLIFSAVVIGLIGIGQYLGLDLFKSLIGRKLILPRELYEQLLDTLKFTFDKYTIYATLYNTNFVGSFSAMLLPISLSLYLFAKNKKIRILTGIFSFITYFTWLGCNSRAGYLGFSAALIIGIVLFRKQIKQNIKPLAILLVVFIITAVGMNSLSSGRVFNQFSRLSIKHESDRIEKSEKKNVKVKDIKIDGFNFTIETENETLTSSLDKNELKFKNESGQLLKVLSKNKNITFTDEKYKDYKINVDEKKHIMTYYIYDNNVKIYISKSGFKILSSGGRLTNVEYPPHLKIFEGKERFASGRGYIWSRSIPMLKDTFILGYGPDNFAIYFPQDDFVGKMNTGYNSRTVVDKPHNMYLQIGINTGVISLIALLILFLIYFVDSTKIYIKFRFSTLEEYLGAGILTSIIGYLVAGMFNDHIISVAPIFWVLLGLGISINRRLKK